MMSTEDRVRAITMLENGWSLRAVAREFGVNPNTIFCLKRKWQISHSVANEPKTSKQRISTANQDTMLRQFYAEHPFTSCKAAIAATAFPGSVTTARKRLRASGLKSYRAAIKTELSERNRQDRINFALHYQNMPIDFWKTVIFSDESTFQSSPNTHTRLVTRPRNRRLAPQYVQQNNRSGRLSVAVWGWMSYAGTGTIWDINGHLTALQYKDILENVMLPSVTSLYDQFTFQHDNSPIHTANVVQQWITDNNLRLLNWPARSPDLNPIENLWGYIKNRMRENARERRDRNLLWQRIVQEWEEVSDDYCHKLTESMPSRLEEVIQNNGGWTHY